ncbi:MAG TPA: NADPH-dependent 7-cyano-7-deazaguanine reductase QueF [Porticoccaceae bacterium]|nr:NADPH-dependent 7-cyano-7-deazaguanine reductase QueF [Porticoccaceae bacterium]
MQEKTQESMLGRSVDYPDCYAPELLQAIDRKEGRRVIGLSDHDTLPFVGADDWTCYELSWLDESGKPRVAIGELHIPCNSPRTVESKSLKLYLNSLNEHRFATHEMLTKTVETDLREVCSAEVTFSLYSVEAYTKKGLANPRGVSLDEQRMQRVESEPKPDILSCADEAETVEEELYSHLFKSRCPVTNQPDWASISISYRGKPIDHASLLGYLVSYRHHQAFHEQCLEQIFIDIQRRCLPESLTVLARFTRRGGLDINPWRSTEKMAPGFIRQGRQ